MSDFSPAAPMPSPPSRVYARQLLPLGYGYPLWTPEPSNQFLRYRRDGLRIGDVGVVDPEDGSFDVFFNICLPSEHPFHRIIGVPDNFVPIDLDELDVAVYPHAENPGSVISTSSVTTLRTTEPLAGEGWVLESRFRKETETRANFDGILFRADRQNGLTYDFNLTSSEGALLILPEGAQRYTLRKRSLFRDVATRNGEAWYNFAEKKLGRIITHDSLYLITGCYKSNSWSVVAFNEASSQGGATEFPAQFKAGQARHGNIPTAYAWETTRAMHWRVGPLGDYNAIPNQAVFISGFKVAMRDSILGRRWMEVEVDAPSAHLQARKLHNGHGGRKGGSRFGKLWRRLVAKNEGSSETGEHNEADSACYLPNGCTDVSGRVTITHIPEILQSFHPSDVINRYLLSKDPSAAVAVTHDSHWGILFEKGLLRPDDLNHEDRLVSKLFENYRFSARDGVACLQAISDSSIRLMDIDDTIRKAWRKDKLDDVEDMLSKQIISHMDSDHSALAKRALIRARLHLWDAALLDAEISIDIQSSVTAHVAKGFALFGKGKYDAAVESFNVALRDCEVSDKVLVSLLRCIISFEVGYHVEGMADIVDLIEHCPVESKLICSTTQAEMYVRLARLATENEDYDRTLELLETARLLAPVCVAQDSEIISLVCGWRFDNLQFTTHQQTCAVLYTAGRTDEAMKSFWKMIPKLAEDVRIRKDNAKWIASFTEQCLKSLSTDTTAYDSEFMKAGKHNKATIVHEVLNTPNPTPLLNEWAKAALAVNLWKDAVISATNFKVSTFMIYRAVCEQLEKLDKITDAIECVQQFLKESGGETNLNVEQAEWVLGLKQRLSKKAENLGDTVVDLLRYGDAVSLYSTALSLSPASFQCLLMKRSKAYMARGLWEDALNDANEVIALNPSSPWGYERKRAALHSAGRYEDAIGTFEIMLLKISQSPDPNIRVRHHEYVNPIQTKGAIRKAVQVTIRDAPRVLIHTISGRLFDKSKRASLFESLPVFKALISSMTTYIDHGLIQREVAQYYRYATFSHTWEDDEPLFDEFVHIAVYDLKDSYTHNKLKMFCKVVQDAGLQWAWSDVCCINKADDSMVQEALVSMFKWYENSTLTIIFLRGVRSLSRRGALRESFWNTRTWTLQEYRAAKVVRFYTEDWTPYLNIDIPNHKEAPEIVSEMEEATGMSGRALMALRPGMDDIREKLRLASTRQTTLVEDAAYSLLGIFSASLPVVYGEGDKALGRLLARLVTGSGDMSILAWTGESGSFNSCLPADITVFEQLPTSHIPPTSTRAEMGVITPRMRISSSSFTLIMKLYNRLHELPTPSFAEQRIKAPCIAFKLGPISAIRSESELVFRARTQALGAVEIRTREDLSQMESLILVHPWIDFLLDRRPVGSITGTSNGDTYHQSPLTDDLPLIPNITWAVKPAGTSHLNPRFRRPFGRRSRDADSSLFPSRVSSTDKRKQALLFITRLKQPFGALLFTPTRRSVDDYRRVAAETLITVQVKELTPTVLSQLVEGVRVLDVL